MRLIPKSHHFECDYKLIALSPRLAFLHVKMVIDIETMFIIIAQKFRGPGREFANGKIPFFQRAIPFARFLEAFSKISRYLEGLLRIKMIPILPWKRAIQFL